MKTSPETTEQETASVKSKREGHLSPDGKWRTFPKVPNLMQYVATGLYFGRVKVNGKSFRESLETNVFSTAKLLLADYVKEKIKQSKRQAVGTFAEARILYEAQMNGDHTIKETSKIYRRKCIVALMRSWPGLDDKRPDKITEMECREWATRFSAKYSVSVFNNTLSTLRMILEMGGLGHDDNPAQKVKRLGVKPKEMHLPEKSEFEAILKTVETSGAARAKRCADFIRFLAFSGCRLGEARLVRWKDVNFDKNEIRVHNSKSAKTNSKPDFRFVPIIEPMQELLSRLKEANPQPESPVCSVGECEKSLTRACKLLGLSRITHHDLRHLFATRCIESNVDIPTVSRWLGHVDGGALAMKVYGHLCRNHSQQMAGQVKF
jgi:integrase